VQATPEPETQTTAPDLAAEEREGRGRRRRRGRREGRPETAVAATAEPGIELAAEPGMDTSITREGEGPQEAPATEHIAAQAMSASTEADVAPTVTADVTVGQAAPVQAPNPAETETVAKTEPMPAPAPAPLAPPDLSAVGLELVETHAVEPAVTADVAPAAEPAQEPLAAGERSRRRRRPRVEGPSATDEPLVLVETTRLPAESNGEQDQSHEKATARRARSHAEPSNQPEPLVMVETKTATRDEQVTP
jgi:hypothetical protein